MKISTDRMVFFDVETLGPARTRPIVQIAAVAVDGDLREIDTFEVKIRVSQSNAASRPSFAERKCDPSVWKRHAVCSRSAAAALARFLRGHAVVRPCSPVPPFRCAVQLAAHNARFDARCLQAWSRSNDIFLPVSYRVICTMQRAMWLFLEQPHRTPPPDFKLRTLCRYFDIPLSNHGYHDALEDVRATVALYRAINGLAQKSGDQQRLVACG